MTYPLRIALFVAFVGCVYGANWALDRWGLVAIGFGLTAPAGVYFAGATFTARDLLHEAGGRWWVIAAIMVGAALSFILEDTQKFAVASGAAFLVSEGFDMAIYSPLRRRRWLIAVAISNAVGLVADSILFLWLAFGSLDHIEGLIVGKVYMTILAIAALALWRGRDLFIGRRQPATS